MWDSASPAASIFLASGFSYSQTESQPAYSAGNASRSALFLATTMNHTNPTLTDSKNISAPNKGIINARPLLETGVFFIAFAFLANYFAPRAGDSALYLIAYCVTLFIQGMIFERLYIIGHEAAHKKLHDNQLYNDIIGQIVLNNLFVPLHVYRSIHQFHHGFNRKNHATSALDVFISPWQITGLVRVFYFAVWYFCVFAGGFFFYSLISIILFMLTPLSLAKKISPAFQKWNKRDRLVSWIEFLSAVVFHGVYIWMFSISSWIYTFGLPLIMFAWIYSMLNYIFHYRTTISKETRYNVRSVYVNRFTQWWLMNFNFHATHHMYPNLAWYELPTQTHPLPESFHEKNQYGKSLWQAITHQLRGPTIVYKQHSETESEPLNEVGR